MSVILSIMGLEKEPITDEVKNQEQFGPYVLRAVFTVYWMNDYPSTEIFYMPLGSYEPGVIATNRLEEKIVVLLQTNYPETQPMRAIFVTQSPFEVTELEVADFGWRMISSVL
jgi:hypothetical protein